LSALEVVIVGGGMIVHDQLLPSFYQLQRLAQIGEIGVCSQHGRTLERLRLSETLQHAFPGSSFRGWPDAAADSDVAHPQLYLEAIAGLAPGNLVVVALPDHLHFDAVMAALKAGQHVLSVKPLVLRVSEAEAIETEAAARQLLVAIEYHKRFDDRSLMARQKYREGAFGEFRLGTACLMEKWYYRRSNFQNWCTVEHSDAFTYIGCHYVDLVHFITGFQPAAVSVYGVRDRYPNGNEGFLWTDARVVWNNGACLNVQNSLSFPDDAPGSNTQWMTLYCSGGDRGGLLRHSDQYRGLEYVYTKSPDSPGAAVYAEPSPDYFQYLDLGGEGLTPVGYGYRSVEQIVRACLRVKRASDPDAVLRDIDAAGLLATPANSRHNERVIEAARRSILDNGREIRIEC
jgi:D-galacturonate reductase